MRVALRQLSACPSYGLDADIVAVDEVLGPTSALIEAVMLGYDLQLFERCLLNSNKLVRVPCFESKVNQLLMVRKVGLEPTRLSATGSEPVKTTNSITCGNYGGCGRSRTYTDLFACGRVTAS